MKKRKKAFQGICILVHSRHLGMCHPFYYLLNSSNLVSKHAAGSPYLGCGQQAYFVQRNLYRNWGSFDHDWKFDVKTGINKYGLYHQWVEASSDNSNDPVIVLDPWIPIIYCKENTKCGN